MNRSARMHPHWDVAHHSLPVLTTLTSQQHQDALWLSRCFVLSLYRRYTRDARDAPRMRRNKTKAPRFREIRRSGTTQTVKGKNQWWMQRRFEVRCSRFQRGTIRLLIFVLHSKSTLGVQKAIWHRHIVTVMPAARLRPERG
jgi:hypothetical protein